MKTEIETAEELALLQSFENNKYSKLEGDELAAMNASLKGAAADTIKKLSKKKLISIRLLEDDIERLKSIAMNEGMPYQTYISHILHKVTTGRVDYR
ncbi:MAG: hypothetical protein HAW58_02085 [Candidatus Thioglobus sp.]|nr:hypothetical protein [Candidatus Thioglobus sp.]